MSIIRVTKLLHGWEAIPNFFASDTRLSVDAVAVGLWLATKPQGWEVRPSAIQYEFSRRPGKHRGREWWARVSGELRDAGYLKLNRTKDAKGQFSSNWDLCIFGLGESSTDMCFTDGGSAYSGLPGSGSACSGSSGSGSAPQSNHHQSNPAPTNNTTQHNKESGTTVTQKVCGEVDAMLLSANLSAGMRKLVEKELLTLDPMLQIAITREFLAHRSTIRHPIPWMRRVCTDTLKAGEFSPAKQHMPAQQTSGLIPEKQICEINGCLKYAATRSSRGWRCVDHISR